MNISSEAQKSLETRIAFLEKHVAEQDAEMYRLSQRIDTLVKVAKEQKAQLAAVAELNSQHAGDMPADEKPPHY
ncbi:SlyX family protein [Coraliomargarita algicola]|uniref:SlyX family protein n=1 Tax=Coraliomargarita algicola TaxID=3092156 RepID=A0ABZ0RV56_9BACT|nr:SlyX family protein [Coraliomargarita sp. J2-16]WPJ96844.1 SlyX family protein [Coraliomargarita sp. J2-16]